MDGRRGVFMRDATGCLRMEPASPMPLHPGDSVEAEGFAEPGRSGPRLADAGVRILGRGPEPRPEPLTVGQVIGGSRSGELVRVSGRLIDGVRTAKGTVLLVESGDAVFEASFEDDRARPLLPVPEAGSRVELTGVALTDAEDLRGPSLVLLLRALADVTVLQGPPWWTPLRARTIAGTLLATVAVALLWAIGLRRLVTRQTAQIRAQLAEIRESEERYRTVFELEKDAIALIDTETLRLVDVNHAAVALYGYEREELLRLAATDLSAEPHKTAEATRAGGDEVAIPLRYHRRKDGTVFPVEIAARFFTLHGRPMLLAAIRDITERQRAQEAREQLISDLEAKNAELERFTYTVSHDLRSPLVTVKGFLGFLRRDAEAGQTARLREDAERIASAVDKMDALLRDLLELSRIGRIANPSEAVALGEVVEEAAELARGRLESRGVRLEIAPGLPVVIGDRDRLVEVVQNLLDNPAKFACDGREPVVRVEHRGTDPEGRAVLYVRDDGRGIDPRHHERVFGLFEKLDPRTEGTGIGLALARRIVAVHGGRIWIESEGEGRGTTVCLALPLAPRS
jgi:PAS domain S-box-containing protein